LRALDQRVLRSMGEEPFLKRNCVNSLSRSATDCWDVDRADQLRSRAVVGFDNRQSAFNSTINAEDFHGVFPRMSSRCNHRNSGGPLCRWAKTSQQKSCLPPPGFSPARIT
jgi:hypothetical protein